MINSVKIGEFSNYWKTAALIPYFRNGQKNIVWNSKPISSLQAILKLIETFLVKFPSEHDFPEDESLE